MASGVVASKPFSASLNGSGILTGFSWGGLFALSFFCFAIRVIIAGLGVGREMFHVYSDETGDEGKGKRSRRWLINSAVLVRAKDERAVMDYERESLKSIWRDNNLDPPPLLHWRRLDHIPRLRVAAILAQKPYIQIAVCLDKSKIPNIANRTLFFQFSCRLLIERVSWLADDHNERFRMIFSKRGGLEVDSLRAAIEGYRREPRSQIRDNFDIGDIDVQPMEKLVMLRAADNSASALGNALNLDQYGSMKPEYFAAMSRNLYRYREWNRIWKYGIKVYPCQNGKAGYDEFISDYPHAEGWFK